MPTYLPSWAECCLEQASGRHTGVLDGILSQEKQQPSPVPASATAIAQFPAAAGQAADNPDPARPAGSRRGRPLGKAASPGVPKEKVTLWLHSPLVASYRDWSWEARSQFSHLSRKPWPIISDPIADANCRSDQHARGFLQNGSFSARLKTSDALADC